MLFIYVMDEISRDRLVSHGYRLVSESGYPTVWVFDNPECTDVDDILDEPYVMSDVLAFSGW